MKMKVISKEKQLCTCCMEVHEVKTVLVAERAIFKNETIEYEARYMYCDATHELYMDEQQMRDNDIRLKDAYREKIGLLTSRQIMAIRVKYGITQSDLSTLLGWGAKTITRYECHQVQDSAHDTILKKIDQDPEWFMTLLESAKEKLSQEAYQKCRLAVLDFYESQQDQYWRRAIQAGYARYQGDSNRHGNTELSLDKVVDVIRYFAASDKVTGLYTVKLMKLLWYADALSYKLRGQAITGLVYQALPMGAVPIGYQSIIYLKGVPWEDVDMDEMSGCRFSLEDADGGFPAISDEDMEILNRVIERLGRMRTKDLVAFMHEEQAYKETPRLGVISFEHARELQI